MAFTYDVSTDRGKVRLLCRDTVEASAVFSDAEVDAFLSLADSDKLLAASLACADKYARGIAWSGITVGGYTLSAGAADGWSKLAEHYKTLAYERAGGVSVEMDWDMATRNAHLDNYAVRGDEQPTD